MAAALALDAPYAPVPILTRPHGSLGPRAALVSRPCCLWVARSVVFLPDASAVAGTCQLPGCPACPGSNKPLGTRVAVLRRGQRECCVGRSGDVSAFITSHVNTFLGIFFCLMRYCL